MMGKNRMTVFSRDILADRERRLELMELFAGERGARLCGFTIHYQPQVDTLSAGSAELRLLPDGTAANTGCFSRRVYPFDGAERLNPFLLDSGY